MTVPTSDSPSVDRPAGKIRRTSRPDGRPKLFRRRRSDSNGGSEHWGSHCGETCLPAFFNQLESKLEGPLLHRAMYLLREQPTRFVSVEEWANALGITREHLTRCLTPLINPHALLQAARVSVALSQLAKQDRLQAGEALDAMGYRSRAHAFAVFKKTTGLTPTEFWKSIQNKSTPEPECLLMQCHLLGALLDRFKRHTHIHV